MRYRIEFADDLMMVMDENGDGHDAHVVRSDGQDEAERLLDEWAREHRFNVASGKRELQAVRNRLRSVCRDSGVPVRQPGIMDVSLARLPYARCRCSRYRTNGSPRPVASSRRPTAKCFGNSWRAWASKK